MYAGVILTFVAFGGPGALFYLVSVGNIAMYSGRTLGKNPPPITGVNVGGGVQGGGGNWLVSRRQRRARV